MRVVLWDTRAGGVSKDFAGGFGVGTYHGRGGIRGKIVRAFFRRDRRPVALAFAYLAAIFRALGHQVEYAQDRVPGDADLYLFNPSLMTLDLERRAIVQARAENPRAKILVTGIVAHTMPEAFADLDAIVVRGEAEQLFFRLDEALAVSRGLFDAGTVEDLDCLPWPDWSLFQPRRFRIVYDFWRFPTAYVQQSRGCTFRCDYCPYIVVDHKTRFRSPEAVVDEMQHGITHHGFRSFKFRDPLFGLDTGRTLELAERLARLPKKIQFSIETRIDLLREETLRALKRAGLTSITFGIETPDERTLRKHRRSIVAPDRQRQFIARCRELGIRTVAGFMIGFPHDTSISIHAVLRYAKELNPTFANFNIVTPYPGTAFRERAGDLIRGGDVTSYDVYTPVMYYEHLTPDELSKLHARCFASFYFRWPYLFANAHLLWPWLAKLRRHREHEGVPRAERTSPERRGRSKERRTVAG